MLVLDEATSALDNDTEAAVMEAVQGLSNDLIVIMIAHRLSTLATCDRVFEIKDGIALKSLLIAFLQNQIIISWPDPKHFFLTMYRAGFCYINF